MTIITIKSDALRRRLTITDEGEPYGGWRMEMPGFKPVGFKADSVLEAFGMGMANVNQLQKAFAPAKRAKRVAAPDTIPAGQAGPDAGSTNGGTKRSRGGRRDNAAAGGELPQSA